MDQSSTIQPGDVPAEQNADDAPRYGFARPEGCQRIALIFQGGGALGAYQAGVYEALHEEGIEPDWVTGVSIGAINSALIAGNPRAKRLERLRTFWERITDRGLPGFAPEGEAFRRAKNAVSALLTIATGQPGFFRPNHVSPWLSHRGTSSATSYYDTAPLRETLVDLIDFSLINSKRIRFAVGAVNVVNGNFAYFDNQREVITPEHVMASGALPPALPMVKIGNDSYWDGGIVSNTPLQFLLDRDDGTNTLVFQVDLFSARGPLPTDMDEVLGRQKDIQYSSRTRNTTDMFRRLLAWKVRARDLLAKIPEDSLTREDRRLKAELSDLPAINILHLIYQQKTYEGQAKDYEFSLSSMREHWQSGYADTKRTLAHKDWLTMPPGRTGIVVHDVHRLHDPARS
jgi:NTE family protein